MKVGEGKAPQFWFISYLYTDEKNVLRAATQVTKVNPIVFIARNPDVCLITVKTMKIEDYMLYTHTRKQMDAELMASVKDPNLQEKVNGPGTTQAHDPQ